MEKPRLNRLTSILTQLQSGKLITASRLSEKYDVSVRTIYRDIRTLIESGVPVHTIDGKGYRLIEGYTLPPIMFTEHEANALITAMKLIDANSDHSLITELNSAMDKIRAVLSMTGKDKADLLENRIVIAKSFYRDKKSNYLSLIQYALTNYKVLKIDYTNSHGESTTREIEPFSFYHSVSEDWVLVAYCRLRKDFRSFRLDRMQNLIELNSTFQKHSITMDDFLEMYHRKEN